MPKKLDLFQIVGNVGKIIEEVLIAPTKRPSKQEEQEEDDEKERRLLPRTEAAVFWDYENFPFPKNIPREMFLETLFPTGSDYKFKAKRVYGKTEVFSSDTLRVLRDHGFEYRKGFDTGKPGSTDYILSSDCLAFCSEYQSPLNIILIAGDIDFFELIRALANNGHYIHLICQDKSKLRQELKRIIPGIIDRSEIEKAHQKLASALISLSQALNYMISIHPNQNLPIEEFSNEIMDQLVEERFGILKGRLKLLRNLPDFKWQYQVMNGKIKNISLASPIDPRSYTEQGLKNRINALFMKLGSESDPNIWEKYWQEFQELVPDNHDQEEVLTSLSRTCKIPLIRSRLQKILIELVLEDQSRLESESVFQTIPDIQSKSKIYSFDDVEEDPSRLPGQSLLMNSIPNRDAAMEIIQIAIEKILREKKTPGTGYVNSVVQDLGTPFSANDERFNFRGWGHVVQEAQARGWILQKGKGTAAILDINPQKPLGPLRKALRELVEAVSVLKKQGKRSTFSQIAEKLGFTGKGRPDLGFTGQGKFIRFAYFAQKAGYVSKIEESGPNSIIRL